jgi:hypothetical protein
MVDGVMVVTEGRRGCGYRKVGGHYLVSEGLSVPCPALPLEVGRCPCCDAGIKPARGWAWFNPAMFFKFSCSPEAERVRPWHECEIYQERGRCEPFQQERAGILWIGGKFYKTPEDWAAESRKMGVSRRISQIPKDFVVGKTWVFVGHREAVTKGCEVCGGKGHTIVDENQPWIGAAVGKRVHCEECEGTGEIKKPGVFHAFKPDRIEKVVDEDITEKEVEKLRKRGITPVVVKRVDEEGRPVDEDGELIES